MYPARWFPVAGYTTDRFAADMRITVPAGYTVVGSGIDSHQTAGDKNTFEFKFDRPSFPGSIAVVKGDPVKVAVRRRDHHRCISAGRKPSMAQAYGEEIGKQMSYFTGTFGLPPYANLTVVETEAGAPNGYAAPGMIFLSPRGIGKQLNSRLLANQVSRQWWEEQVSPATRNHIWLTNGLAAYSELLWTEHAAGAGAMERSVARHDGGSADGGQRAHHPVVAPGGLFARVLGAHREQGRGRAAHAALRHRRRQVLSER